MVYLLYAGFNDLMYYSVLEALTFEFNIGFVLGWMFLIQVVSGLILACFYVADSGLAFDCVVFLMRNVLCG